MPTPNSYDDGGMQFGSQTLNILNTTGTKSDFIAESFSLDDDSNVTETKNEFGKPNKQHAVDTIPTGSVALQLPGAVLPAKYAEFIAERIDGEMVPLWIKKVGQATGNDQEKKTSIDVRLVLHSVITSELTANGVEGTPFTYTIEATGEPTTYAATELPAGLTVNPATGAISGTPTADGTTSVTISATNASGTGTASLSIVIATTP